MSDSDALSQRAPCSAVLIIEDAMAFALSVSEAIKASYDFEVYIASDYQQAKAMLARHKDELFVAIADLNLPDAQDGATAELMSKEGIPCIAFTGNFSPKLRDFVHRVGVADYVLKKDRYDIDYVVKMVGRLYKNRGLQVLVVDDRQSARELLKAMLERQCYQVLVADSGKQALTLLEQNPDVRIVLTDLIMEGMDGFGLLTEIRRAHDVTQMAIIGISGKASNAEIARFIKYGGNDFLLKPFEQEQVVCRVNSNVEMLEQFDRLSDLSEQKNELIGMAAHDIRGPLGVVASATSLMAKENLSERGKMLLNLCQQSTDQMMDLLNSLLDMSAIENAKISVHLDRILLSDVLQKVATDNALLIEGKAQRLHLQIPPDPIYVDGDKLRLKEMLENLLSNAIKYSQRGANIELCLSANVSHARIQVIDEAGGIPKSERSELFKAFAKISTKPTDGERSTGLGLAICKRIAELHHGTISYKDNASLGSIFEVVLPLSRGH